MVLEVDILPPHGLGGIVGGGGLGKTQLRRPSTIGRIQADDVGSKHSCCSDVRKLHFQ